MCLSRGDSGLFLSKGQGARIGNFGKSGRSDAFFFHTRASAVLASTVYNKSKEKHHALPNNHKTYTCALDSRCVPISLVVPVRVPFYRSRSHEGARCAVYLTADSHFRSCLFFFSLAVTVVRSTWMTHLLPCPSLFMGTYPKCRKTNGAAQRQNTHNTKR